MNFTSDLPTLVQGRSQDAGPRQLCPLGTRQADRFGRVFRYAQVGSAALQVGYLYYSVYTIASLVGITVAPAAPGATQLVVTSNGTYPADTFTGGTLVVTNGTGAGQALPIAAHGPLPNGSPGIVKLFPDEPLTLALDGTSRLDLFPSVYANVRTSFGGHPIGVAVNVANPGDFAWLQTWGMSAIVGDVNGTVGIAYAGSQATPGGVSAIQGTGAGPYPVNALVGIATMPPASGLWKHVFLTIAP